MDYPLRGCTTQNSQRNFVLRLNLRSSNIFTEVIPAQAGEASAGMHAFGGPKDGVQ